MPALFQHELRWARTVQSLVPVEFALAAVQFPLFWSALMVGASGGVTWAWLAFASAWALRGAAAWGIDRRLGLASRLPIWCLPFRDLLSVTVMLASYRTDRVAWRGQTLRATRPRLARVPNLASGSLAPGKG